MFSLQQNWRTRGWNRFCLEDGGCVRRFVHGHKQCIHVSKCRNYKIKREEKNFYWPEIKNSPQVFYLTSIGTNTQIWQKKFSLIIVTYILYSGWIKVKKITRRKLADNCLQFFFSSKCISRIQIIAFHWNKYSAKIFPETDFKKLAFALNFSNILQSCKWLFPFFGRHVYLFQQWRELEFSLQYFSHANWPWESQIPQG
jgi:hypothetical protein